MLGCQCAGEERDAEERQRRWSSKMAREQRRKPAAQATYVAERHALDVWAEIH